MNKYKVYVYAICKNEEKFVHNWVKSMSEADGIYVLDTGSNDNTVQLLLDENVNVVSKKIIPWRFDVARNESLKLVPTDADICVCTDFDELFEPGWREKLENTWEIGVNRVLYTYNWSINDKGIPVVTFFREKIHDRFNYKWVYPVHEIPEFTGENEVVKTNEEIVLNHFPDTSKSRGSYLNLLELSVKENPNDDRNLHYLGREYMYYGKWNECIDTLIKHLKLKSATWKDERSASMRFIARAYVGLGRLDEANLYLDKAIEEAPYLRDPYVEKALLSYNNGDYKNAEKYLKKALRIKKHEKTYINETFSWDNTIYDLLSICTFYNGKFSESLKWVNKAILIESNERLLNNKKIIEEYIKNN